MYQRIRFLSPNEFHAALQSDGMTLARHRIYQMCESGELSAWRNGSHWRIDANEVTELPKRLLDPAPARPPTTNQIGVA